MRGQSQTLVPNYLGPTPSAFGRHLGIAEFSRRNWGKDAGQCESSDSVFKICCSSHWCGIWIQKKWLSKYLKPIAAREREEEAARANERAELEAIRKAEAAKVPLF
ncbi:hypothetical protein pdam_00004979 [Pocillopora damicornis]|uniref:Uncharacterized protein n=1 Tax=Pocillopora damicornis TaxID=46731 RepID=A0A3M6UVN5_POCDA|nr:hypothetical protein pdam_00004979 [Pocillopora damicornis]